MNVKRTPEGYFIVLGGLNLDILAKPSGRFRLGDSNPGHIIRRPGGVGFNIARNLARIGLKVRFLTARGDARSGDDLWQTADAPGIDLSHALLREGYSSSHYLAIHNEEGDMAVAINDMAVFDTMRPDEIESWIPLGDKDHSDCIGAIIEPNMPAEVLYALASRWNVPLFADAVSQAKCKRLTASLPYLQGLKVNRIEAEALSGLPVNSIQEATRAARGIMGKDVKTVCLSLSEEGALFMDETMTVLAKPSRIVHDANATGAGDAMASAFSWASVQGFPLEEIARYAVAASSIAVESEEAVNPQLTMDLLEARAQLIQVEVIE